MSDVPAHVAHVCSSRLSNVKRSRGRLAGSCPNPGHSKGRGDQSPSLRVAVGETGRVLDPLSHGCPTTTTSSRPSACPTGTSSRPPGRSTYFRAAREAKVITPRRGRDPGPGVPGGPRPPDPGARPPGPPVRPGPGQTSRSRPRVQVDPGGVLPGGLPGGEPGFDPAAYLGPVPGLRLAGKDPSGLRPLLIPVRDPERRIVALKVRRFAGDPGTLPVRPGRPERGPVPTGPSWTTGTCSDHCASGLPRGRSRPTWRRVKSNRCTHRLRPRRRELEARGNLGPGTSRGYPELILVAFDWWDVVEKEGVRSQARALLNALADLGTTVAIEHWPHREYKGVDDLLAAGHQPDVTRGLAGVPGPARLPGRARAPWPPRASGWSRRTSPRTRRTRASSRSTSSPARPGVRRGRGRADRRPGRLPRAGGPGRGRDGPGGRPAGEHQARVVRESDLLRGRHRPAGGQQVPGHQPRPAAHGGPPGRAPEPRTSGT
jgi:hypothetical protein